MADNLLDLRTIKGFQGASETPFTDNLLGVNTGKTITGQEFSDNPIIKPFQQFNKALGTGLLETGEKAFNLGMGAVNLPFAFAGDTAEGLYEMLPEDWQAKTSQLMYNSGGSMDPDEFGDQFYGHLVEGVFAFPTLSEFQPWFRANQGKKPPKEIVEAIVEKIGTQPNQFSQQLYLSYNKNINNPKQLVTNKVDAPEGYLKEIADFYEGAKHQPNHPKIQASYEALINETLAQYQHMIDGGIIPKIYIGSKGKPEPYVSSGHMMNDVANNKSLKFLKTNLDDLPPDHPLAQPSGIILDGQELIMNDVFRVVHDFYGHTPNGFQFGPKGEYNAFRSHANMYSDASIPALANETLFQNAWVNYNKSMRREDGTVPKPNDPDFIPQNERPFADQKVILFDESLLNKDPNFENVNASIGYTMEEAGPMFEGLNIADETKNGIIYEYDWYTKSKSWENDKGNLWHGLKVNAKEQSKFENNIQKKIIDRELIISQGETWAEQSKIKAQLDTQDLKDLNKVRVEQGLEPIKETTVGKIRGKPVEAKFVSGNIDGVQTGLKENEIKRIAYIMSDSIKSTSKYFDKDPLIMGLVQDTQIAPLSLRNRIDALKNKVESGKATSDEVNKLNELLEIKNNQVKTTLAVRQNNKFLQPPYSYSEMETLSHEVGHLIHQQLSKNTIPDFLQGSNFNVSLAKAELEAVSKRMRPNLWNDKHIKSYKGDIPDKVKQRHLDQVYYRNKDVELLADFIKGYLVDPKLTKRLAPTMSAILKQMVNESWFADILKLAKADTMPKDGLLKKQEINSGLLNTAMV